MATNNAIAVGPLEASAGGDAGVVEELTELINGVYATAESGLWRDGTTRTTKAELADLIAARQIAVATREERIVGAVQLHDVTEDLSEFGMLVAAPEQRASGARPGAPRLRRTSQRRAWAGERVQLQLLVPRGWRHPSKEFLEGVVRTARLSNRPHHQHR